MCFTMQCNGIHDGSATLQRLASCAPMAPHRLRTESSRHILTWRTHRGSEGFAWVKLAGTGTMHDATSSTSKLCRRVRITVAPIT
jgi:hypothetical protein